MFRWVGVWVLSITGEEIFSGRLVFGNPTDRFVRIRLFVALTAGIGVSVLAPPFVRVPVALLNFNVVYELFYGGASALVLPLIADPSIARKTWAITGTNKPVLFASVAVSLLGTGYILFAGRWVDGGDGDGG